MKSGIKDAMTLQNKFEKLILNSTARDLEKYPENGTSLAGRYVDDAVQIAWEIFQIAYSHGHGDARRELDAEYRALKEAYETVSTNSADYARRIDSAIALCDSHFDEKLADENPVLRQIREILKP